MKVDTIVPEQNATERDSRSLFHLDAHIAKLLIETPAITDEQIAMKFGLSRQAVNRRRNSDAVKKLLRDTLSIPEREVRRLSAKALSRLESLLDHEDPKVKLAAAAALLKLGTQYTGSLPFDLGV